MAVQTDPRGRRYIDDPVRGRSYISPGAFGEAMPGDTGWRGAQWNPQTGQVDTPFKWGKAITLGTAAGLGGAAFSALGGFGAAPSAAASQSAAVAPGAASAASAAPAVVTAAGPAGGSMGGISLGSLLKQPFMGDVVRGGFGVYGAHQAGKSADRVADYQRQSDDRVYALEVAREAEAKRQWEAQQAFQAQQWAAQEDERRYQREQSDYSRRIGDEDRTRRNSLEDAKEARAVPYRAASQAALARLGDLLGMGLAPGAWLSPSQAGRR